MRSATSRIGLAGGGFTGPEIGVRGRGKFVDSSSAVIGEAMIVSGARIVSAGASLPARGTMCTPSCARCDRRAPFSAEWQGWAQEAGRAQPAG